MRRPAALPKSRGRKNTNTKGNEYEKAAVALLEADGWFIHRAQRTSYQRAGIWRSNNNDVFNIFDLVAVRVGERVRFIQVTDTGHMDKKRVKMRPLLKHFTESSVEIWGWVGGRKQLDGRYKKFARVFVRRQYFRRIRWVESQVLGQKGWWKDVTSYEDGWIDGYVPDIVADHPELAG